MKTLGVRSLDCIVALLLSAVLVTGRAVDEDVLEFNSTSPRSTNGSILLTWQLTGNATSDNATLTNSSSSDGYELGMCNLTIDKIDCGNGTQSNVTCGNGTEHSNSTTEHTNTFFDTVLEGWKQLFSKTYWEQRIHNPHYWNDIMTTLFAGILVCGILLFLACTLRCYCRRRRRNKRNRLSKIKTIKNDKDGVQWTLLEKNSSDEEI